MLHVLEILAEFDPVQDKPCKSVKVSFFGAFTLDVRWSSESSRQNGEYHQTSRE
jgi:hypothetical protein